MESLSPQADKGQYDYRPQRKIDTTEYKFEDIKPLMNSSTPLQFRIDDRPFPFCPREMELHLRVKFKVADAKALAYHANTTKFIVGPVNSFSYSCEVNNAETKSASGVNLAYREYFHTLLESDPWDEQGKLKRQGWYRDVPSQMEKWGGDQSKLADYNEGGVKCQKALVNYTGEYKRYQGHFGKNPFDFTSQNGIQVECTANGVPMPKASLSLKDKYKVYDLLLNVSGKHK